MSGISGGAISGGAISGGGNGLAAGGPNDKGRDELVQMKRKLLEVRRCPVPDARCPSTGPFTATHNAANSHVCRTSLSRRVPAAAVHAPR
jgi:hypothetical protein